MSLVIQAATAPFLDFVSPIFWLGYVSAAPNPSDPLVIGMKQESAQFLILTALRTATAVALFFLAIPSAWIFIKIYGHQSLVSHSFTFALQFLIHPYAAVLSHAYAYGGCPLIMRVINAVFTRKMVFTEMDLHHWFVGLAFCLIAQPLKDYSNRLDEKYIEWSSNLALRLYPNPEFVERLDAPGNHDAHPDSPAIEELAD